MSVPLTCVGTVVCVEVSVPLTCAVVAAGGGQSFDLAGVFCASDDGVTVLVHVSVHRQTPGAVCRRAVDASLYIPLTQQPTAGHAAEGNWVECSYQQQSNMLLF